MRSSWCSGATVSRGWSGAGLAPVVGGASAADARLVVRDAAGTGVSTPMPTGRGGHGGNHGAAQSADWAAGQPGAQADVIVDDQLVGTVQLTSLTAAAAFRFTYEADPGRHLRAARLLDPDAGHVQFRAGRVEFPQDLGTSRLGGRRLRLGSPCQADGRIPETPQRSAQQGHRQQSLSDAVGCGPGAAAVSALAASRAPVPHPASSQSTVASAATGAAPRRRVIRVRPPFGAVRRPARR